MLLYDAQHLHSILGVCNKELDEITEIISSENIRITDPSSTLAVPNTSRQPGRPLAHSDS